MEERRKRLDWVGYSDVTSTFTLSWNLNSRARLPLSNTEARFNPS